MPSHEMTDDERRAFLSQGTRTAKVATTMKDGTPHVMPVWFALEDDDLLFNTGADTVKGRALRRDPRISIAVDEETPPYSFVHIRGTAEIIEEMDEVRRVATLLGARYMGADRAEEFGARNGVPGELLIRVRPERTVARTGIAD
jgi:PPOX class probable F420-dependent enzyme